jgi:hypothetical protein
MEKFSTGHVDIDLAISDTDLKDLQIDLISPDGTVSVLAEHLIQIGSQTYLSFTFDSVQFMGEKSPWNVDAAVLPPDAGCPLYGLPGGRSCLWRCPQRR